ncbi:MAG: bifunctional D-glycero-beta-D-manno-heptose-7-phosphate kinase/D-glycero-beta-D-manno-heptose 1-phosphate adenylyltransferase HldE [Gammaproteobacteria bacterium]|nr:bifunctional D-glycero-beta-D-manno-heptose-7-phosphate kinase/D-glycero-beta-D-manno-heptose 1-phosphate adenylyltransferase HldE [Gammaproteobacteria bacterium]
MELPSLQSVHVLVVGDLMLDRYWIGDARRISQEAPVPVVDIDHTEDRPGGAANVALNIASLGARCTLVGLVGEDEAAEQLRATLSAAGVTCDFITIADWSTIVKLRVISQKQQLIRADFEKKLPVDVRADVEVRVKKYLDSATAIVLQDYDKGCLEDPQREITAAVAANVPVVADPKHKPFAKYAGANLFKPNTGEFAAEVGRWADDSDLVQKAIEVCRAHNFGAVVVTRGGRGMSVALADGRRQHIPGRPVDVFDVTGAGDTSAAVLAVMTSLGWDPVAWAQVANIAGGIVVGKLGTAAVTGPELAMALAATDRGDRGILTRAQLIDAVQQARGSGQKIVFTNGCFDILHAGHVAYLEEARALGDRLIVAVNDDASVTRLKGKGRPVEPLERRLRVLSGLSSVDWVVGFPEDTPVSLIETLQPELLVKGGDYGPGEVVGADMVNAYGGEVRVLGLVEDCSTSAIVESIQKG